MPLNARRTLAVKQALLLLAILGIAAAFWWSAPIRAAYGEVVAVLSGLVRQHPIGGVAAFMALAIIAAMFSSISSVPIVPVAVSIWGPWWTMAFLFVGWLCGDLAAYAIGAQAGRPIARLFISAARLRQWEAHFERGTTFFPAMLFRLATPAETGYLFGMVRYPLAQYLLLNVIVQLLLSFLAVSVSEAVLERRMALFSLLVLVAAAVGAVSIAVYFRLRRPRKFRRIVAAVVRALKDLKGK